MSEYFDIAKKEYAKYGVDVEEAIAETARIPVSVHCWQGDAVVEKLDVPACDNTMGYEIRDFAAAVAGELDPLPYERATLASLRIMDEIRAQTGVAFPADAAS